MDLADTVRIKGGFGFLHQGVTLGIGGQHHVKDGVVRRLHLLRHPAHARATAQPDRAVGRRLFDLLADQLQQGGFARAIAADQPDFPARRDLGGGILEQGARADPVIKV